MCAPDPAEVRTKASPCRSAARMLRWAASRCDAGSSATSSSSTRGTVSKRSSGSTTKPISTRRSSSHLTTVSSFCSSICTSTAGWRRRYSVISGGSSRSEEVAPNEATRSVPRAMPRSASASCRKASFCWRMSLARCSSRAPASVSGESGPSRRTSCTCSSPSSARMAWLTALWVMPSSAAAREKLPARARAANTSSWVKVMGSRCPGHEHSLICL